MTPEQKYELITKDLQEVLNADIIKDILAKDEPLKIYWGTAPTGKPHCGYFAPMIKLAHFLKAGCKLTVLVADLHAYLDNMKAPLEVVQYRAKYYEFIVKSILKSINVPIDKLQFTLGSSFQLTPKYTMDIFRLSNIVSQNDAKRAGADVVKQVANPLLSGLIYPLMQTLDEEHLGVDVQFGGVDQRKIFVLAEETLQSIGYKKRAHLMNKMVPGLTQGGKMSASDPNSKIDIIEDDKVVIKKINSAYCAQGDIENNGPLAFLENIVQPIQELKADKPGYFNFFINRPDKYGGPITYTSVETLKNDFEAEKLSPVDLKAGLASELIQLLAPIKAEYESSQEFQEAEAKGYPAADVKVKKEKKAKDKGTKYPGTTNGEITEKLDQVKLDN